MNSSNSLKPLLVRGTIQSLFVCLALIVLNFSFFPIYLALFTNEWKYASKYLPYVVLFGLIVAFFFKSRLEARHHTFYQEQYKFHFGKELGKGLLLIAPYAFFVVANTTLYFLLSPFILGNYFLVLFYVLVFITPAHYVVNAPDTMTYAIVAVDHIVPMLIFVVCFAFGFVYWRWRYVIDIENQSLMANNDQE